MARGSKRAKRRLRKLDKELTLVGSDIRTLSRAVEKPDGRIDRLKLHTKLFSEEQVVEESTEAKPGAAEDTRFSEYFSGSIEHSRPLRHERRIQRNKAVFMALCALLVLLWVVLKMLR